MINISDLVTVERVAHDAHAGSKKRALELLSRLITNSQAGLSEQEVFESLVARERLGATGLGRGVAIPHGRLKNLSRPIGAFMHLSQGVDYDASDKQPVDLLFALLVPEKSTEEHLQILSTLAQMFSDKPFREQLRGTDSNSNVHDLLVHWQPHTPPT
jgi:PTS system nitrogen regulatory IIA component